MKYYFISLLLLLSASSAHAQFYSTQYRPPNLDWQQLETPRFNILFPAGEDSAAYRTARILEHQYGEVQELVGGELRNFPVILNNYNDLSNGFVTPLHFRSEIEIPPVKGKTMNPRSGLWLETVAPHELVHALHFSHLDGPWAGLLKIISPDVARSMHTAIPLGVHEGIATHYETIDVREGGGRGNYPYFTNQFSTVFQSGSRWSMGQMLSTSRYSRPFDRHYIGGYEFTSWLQEVYGPDTTEGAIDFYIRWPFLGYGVALKHATGLWPAQLYNRFEEQLDNDHAAQNSSATYDPLPISYRGRMLRRPLWLSERELLLYGSFYNARPGFYRYDLDSGRFDPILETRVVGDYAYDLSADRSRLIYSNYRPSPIYDRTFTMELYQADLSSGETRQLSKGLRAHAPVVMNGDLLALQTDHDRNALVRLDSSSIGLTASLRLSVPDTEFKRVVPNPADSNLLAVVANRLGMQGLWLADLDSLEHALSGVPDISFPQGSVFDPAWSRDGERLLFTSDHTGTMQIYEYLLTADEVRQVTTAPYNAMEGSYSPDGNRIAFIVQQGNERLPVVLERSDYSGRRLSPADWNRSADPLSLQPVWKTDPSLLSESRQWTRSEYRPGLGWLAPRTIFPDIDEVSNSDIYKIGVGLYSNDLLQRNLYQLDLSVVQNLPWYDLTYRHTGFFPGFEINLFSRPSFPFLSLEFPNESVLRQQLLQQDIGASLSLPFRYTLERNTRLTSLFIEPEANVRGVRYYELDHGGSPASEFANFYTGAIRAQLNYKLQQNIRDLQPNAGFIWYSELEHYFNDDSVTVDIDENSFLLSFRSPTAFRGGAFLFWSPMRRWNQSLRIGIEGLTQTSGIFSNQSLVSDGFSEPVFPRARNMLRVSTRYTVPLLFPDDGGFLLPFYLSSVYLVGFTDTVLDLGNSGIGDLFTESRNVVGLGIRSRFRLSNFSLDLGLGIALEPRRNKWNLFVGDF